MRHLAALAVAVLAAGCGGGVWVSLGSGEEDAPIVSLAVSPRVASPGDVVQMSAATTGSHAVAVSFYRLDGDRAVLITVDRDRPFEAAVVVPADGRGVVQLYAEAGDGFGNRGTSPLEVVTVRN